MKRYGPDSYRIILANKLSKLMGDETEKSFAPKVGLSESALNSYLTCRRGANIDQLERICTSLGISIGELLKK